MFDNFEGGNPNFLKAEVTGRGFCPCSEVLPRREQSPASGYCGLCGKSHLQRLQTLLLPESRPTLANANCVGESHIPELHLLGGAQARITVRLCQQRPPRCIGEQSVSVYRAYSLSCIGETLAACESVLKRCRG
jgi:hypothetical protein